MNSNADRKVYAEYMQEFSALLRPVLDRAAPLETDLDAILKVCESKPVERLIAAPNFDAALLEQRKRVFSDVIRWMLSLDEVPDEQVERFCNAGERLGTAAGEREALAVFQEIRAAFRKSDGQSEREAEELCAVTDFSRYIDSLKRELSHSLVIIAAMDTVWGEPFTPALTRKLRELGLQAELYGKFRYAYYAVIDQGVVRRERLGATQQEVLRYQGSIGGIALDVESVGWEVHGPHAKIAVNGQDYAVSRRGLNIVVFDRTTKTVADSVCFDTWVKMNCRRYIHLPMELEKWRTLHPGVTVISTGGRIAFPQSGLTKEEHYIKENILAFYDIPKHLNDSDFPLRSFFDGEEEIIESITPPRSYHDASGVRHFEDTRGRAVNTVGGHRVTTDQPEHGKRTVYLVGGCGTFGIAAADCDTTASWLQRALNEKAPEEQLIVQNYGYYLEGDDRSYNEERDILFSLPVQSGDIVVIQWPGLQDVPHLPRVDLTAAGKETQQYGLLHADMMGHLTRNGYHLIADHIFELLQKNRFFSYAEKQSASSCAEPVNGSDAPAKELADCKESLKKLYAERFSVGAAVMNCNPFTLGHRYLIEQACRQCAHLIVFVVQEDQSVFPFQDRLRMVQEGTADLEQVTVLPSGQFILSSLTFSEYFNKAELQDRAVDASKDVKLFGSEIAPCLHITKRFVGEEPFDTVTRQYNNDMKNILPQYGIEVVELKRLAQGQDAISASEVRRRIGAGRLDAVRELVPQTTFSYIEAHLEELKEKLQT